MSGPGNPRRAGSCHPQREREGRLLPHFFDLRACGSAVGGCGKQGVPQRDGWWSARAAGLGRTFWFLAPALGRAAERRDRGEHPISCNLGCSGAEGDTNASEAANSVAAIRASPSAAANAALRALGRERACLQQVRLRQVGLQQSSLQQISQPPSGHADVCASIPQMGADGARVSVRLLAASEGLAPGRRVDAASATQSLSNRLVRCRGRSPSGR